MSSVLIVDDDEGMVETLADILRAKAYDVATANSGDHAVAAVHARPVDVVLMDIRMSGLNGVQALKAMKRADPALPVIMMTAFTTDDLVEQARRATALDVVPKPLDLERVLTLLEHAVVARRAAPGDAR